MLDVTLNVQSEQLYTYGPDRVTIAPVEREVSVSGLDIEVEDISVELGPASDGTSTFLAEENPSDLLPGTDSRAQILVDGEELMNGSIRTGDIRYDRQRRTWRLLVRQQAQQDFWQALSGVWFYELTEPYTSGSTGSISDAPVESVPVQTVYDIEGQGFSYTKDSTQRAFGVLSSLQFIFSELGIQHDLPAELFRVRGQYEDTGVDDDVGRIERSPTIYANGIQEVRTFVEAVSEWVGWRFRVEYADFPGTQLQVSVEDTDWNVDLGRVVTDDITSQELSGRSDIRRRPSTENWGLQMSEDELAMPKDPPRSPEDTDDFTVQSVVPPIGGIAAEEWAAAPARGEAGLFSGGTPFEDPRDLQMDLVQPEPIVQAPIQVVDETTMDQGAYTERVAWGPLYLEIDPLDEPDDIFDDDTIYVFETYTREEDGVDRIYPVLARFVDAPQTADPIDAILCATWAQAPYRQQIQRRGGWEVLEGDYASLNGTEVGDQLRRVEVADTGTWMPWSIRSTLGEERSTLEARRPLITDEDPALPQPPATLSDWTVTSLDPTFFTREETVNNTTGESGYVGATWGRTESQYAAEIRYDVEIKNTAEDNPTWETAAQFGTTFESPYTPAILTRVYIPASGDSYVASDYRIRVRPVAIDGTVGGWLEIAADGGGIGLAL